VSTYSKSIGTRFSVGFWQAHTKQETRSGGDGEAAGFAGRGNPPAILGNGLPTQTKSPVAGNDAMCFQRIVAKFCNGQGLFDSESQFDIAKLHACDQGSELS
jgi:hypothetical protein